MGLVVSRLTRRKVDQSNRILAQTPDVVQDSTSNVQETESWPVQQIPSINIDGYEEEEEGEDEENCSTACSLQEKNRMTRHTNTCIDHDRSEMYKSREPLDENTLKINTFSRLEVGFSQVLRTWNISKC